MNGLIWFWPGVALAFAIGWLVASDVARVLRADRRLAWFLVFAVGLIVAASVTPIRPPVGVDLTVARNCDFGRRWFAAVPDVLAGTESTLYILAYLPAGLAIALLPVGIRSGLTFAGVLALPGAIEALHYFAPVLARACKSGDAIDGLTGLAIGLGAGVVLRLGRWAFRHRQPVAPF